MERQFEEIGGYEESNFDIRKNVYFIEIIRDFDGRKERITKRVASCSLTCHECHKLIRRGQKYIRDKFWHFRDYNRTWKTTNYICLKCWKGDIPVLVSTNWKGRNAI